MVEDPLRQRHPRSKVDHLKAIFDKTGVRSRRQLRAPVFAVDNLPEIMQRRPLDAGGHLDAPRPA